MGRRPRDLPPTLANLTPQAYNSIQYDANHSLWNNIEERKLDIQIFHVGMVPVAACDVLFRRQHPAARDPLPSGAV